MWRVRTPSIDAFREEGCTRKLAIAKNWGIEPVKEKAIPKK